MKPFVCVIIALSLFLLPSCFKKDEDTSSILLSLMDKCDALPNGQIFEMGAEEGEAKYLSSSMIESMYGEGATDVFLLVEDYAIYISSFAAPYEIAVFRCYSSSDAIKVETMCRGRADILSVAFRGSEYHDLYKNIRVLRDQDSVVFLMVDNSDDVYRIAKRLI